MHTFCEGVLTKYIKCSLLRSIRGGIQKAENQPTALTHAAARGGEAGAEVNCGLSCTPGGFSREIMQWIFRHYRALMDLGPNSGPCSGLEAPPDLGCLLESGPALRTVWTVTVWIPDPGETHQAKLGEAGTGFSHPKIQNPESGIRDGTG